MNHRNYNLPYDHMENVLRRVTVRFEDVLKETVDTDLDYVMDLFTSMALGDVYDCLDEPWPWENELPLPRLRGETTQVVVRSEVEGVLFFTFYKVNSTNPLSTEEGISISKAALDAIVDWYLAHFKTDSAFHSHYTTTVS